jgi:hypothetical protein
MHDDVPNVNAITGVVFKRRGARKARDSFSSWHNSAALNFISEIIKNDGGREFTPCDSVTVTDT